MSGVGLSRPSWRVDFGLVLVTTALVLAGIQLSATPGIDGCVVGLQNPQLRSAGESLPNKKRPRLCTEPNGWCEGVARRATPSISSQKSKARRTAGRSCLCHERIRISA